MTIVERVKALELPLDELVVIGSGLLDALELRTSRDIDLVVSGELFAQLMATGRYRHLRKHDEAVLERGDVEIWRTWGELPDESYDALRRNGIDIDDVRFCSPEVIIRHKQLRATEKDLRDITLLQTYMTTHTNLF